jgi:hypothetical protein
MQTNVVVSNWAELMDLLLGWLFPLRTLLGGWLFLSRFAFLRHGEISIFFFANRRTAPSIGSVFRGFPNLRHQNRLVESEEFG